MLRSVYWSLESEVSFRPETSITKAFLFSLASLFILYFFLRSFLYIYLFLHFPPPLPPPPLSVLLRTHCGVLV